MVTKDQIEFYLRRHIRELEDQTEDFNHVRAAQSGMTYNQRSQALASHEARQEKLQTELECLREALICVSSYYNMGR